MDAKLVPKRSRQHLWLLLIWAVYVGLFFVPGSDPKWISYMPLDDKIPFLEYFVVFYVLWFPWLAAVTVYTMIAERQAFCRYMVMWLIGGIPVAVSFLFVNNGITLRPEVFPRENFFTWVVSLIYAADKPLKVCPSIHVFGCIVNTATTFSCPKLRKRPWVCALTLILLVGISASTVFIKQHSVLDVIAAVPFSLAIIILSCKVLLPGREKPC